MSLDEAGDIGDGGGPDLAQPGASEVALRQQSLDCADRAPEQCGGLRDADAGFEFRPMRGC